MQGAEGAKMAFKKMTLHLYDPLITSSSFADVHTRIVHIYDDDLVAAYEEGDGRHDT